jgi:signal transduction histidine kinase
LDVRKYYEVFGQMVPNKAQFDDRIRNLMALAEDNSTESRTLLFSHICDLFLQKRPMESDNQVRMLIESIIDNAMKFTPNGGKIIVGLRPDQNGNCVISCKDNGKGMTPQEVTKAFSDDTQLDDIYSDPSTGIGFGISYVQKLIEKHDGSLSIISAPGEGTCLNLNLPKSRLV